MPIIYNLSKGKMRFREIERTVEGINTRMLVKELKNLEANGIVTREVFATVPPDGVEGIGLLENITELCRRIGGVDRSAKLGDLFIT